MLNKIKYEWINLKGLISENKRTIGTKELIVQIFLVIFFGFAILLLSFWDEFSSMLFLAITLRILAAILFLEAIVFLLKCIKGRLKSRIIDVAYVVFGYVLLIFVFSIKVIIIFSELAFNSVRMRNVYKYFVETIYCTEIIFAVEVIWMAVFINKITPFFSTISDRQSADIGWAATLLIPIILFREVLSWTIKLSRRKEICEPRKIAKQIAIEFRTAFLFVILVSQCMLYFTGKIDNDFYLGYLDISTVFCLWIAIRDRVDATSEYVL